MQKLTIRTHKKRQIIDITRKVEGLLRAKSEAPTGLCQLNVLHTTAAITTADLDPGTDLDMLDAFEHMVPNLHYRHPHDPSHVPDHILSTLIGTSLGVLVEEGQVLLGTWQRIILVELDGPRDREIAMGFIEAT